MKESSLSAGGLQYTAKYDNDREKQSHKGHQRKNERYQQHKVLNAIVALHLKFNQPSFGKSI